MRMFLVIIKFLILLIYFTVATNVNPLTDENGNPISNIKVRLRGDTNDSVIEFFHNCKCIAYYQCPEIRKKLIEAQARLQSPPCSDDNYLCCVSSPCESCTSTEANSISPIPDNPTTSKTTETPAILRQINVTCGLPKTSLNVRILTSDTESENTIPGEIPWMVEIFEKRPGAKSYRFKCAGSLIHPKVVLTAQHCVRSNKEAHLKTVAAGLEIFQNLGTPDNERNVFKIIKQPQYYSGGLYNDIALLILEEQYDYSNYPLNSICIPKINQVFDGKRCLGVGWGPNSELKNIPLKKVDVPIIEFGKCQQLLRKTRLGNDFDLHSSFMCAGGEEGKDTCKGDGGGPLICMDDYTFFQAGIISWGVDVDTCGLKDQPGIYTNVAQFRDWIVQELARYNIDLN